MEWFSNTIHGQGSAFLFWPVWGYAPHPDSKRLLLSWSDGVLLVGSAVIIGELLLFCHIWSFLSFYNCYQGNTIYSEIVLLNRRENRPAKTPVDRQQFALWAWAATFDALGALTPFYCRKISASTNSARWTPHVQYCILSFGHGWSCCWFKDF